MGNELNYTKGEWKPGSLNDEPFARSVLSIYREDGRRIAEISREGFLSMEEAKANAQLIAATPELYEALEDAEIYISKDPTLNILHKRIKQALAKAEGKNG